MAEMMGFSQFGTQNKNKNKNKRDLPAIPSLSSSSESSAIHHPHPSSRHSPSSTGNNLKRKYGQISSTKSSRGGSQSRDNPKMASEQHTTLKNTTTTVEAPRKEEANVSGDVAETEEYVSGESELQNPPLFTFHLLLLCIYIVYPCTSLCAHIYVLIWTLLTPN